MRRIPALIIAGLLSFNLNAATTFLASQPSDNSATEAAFLAAIGGGPAEFFLDFESGYMDGDTVNGPVGIGGLSITGIAQGGGPPRIEAGNGSIGGSNPIGTYALELADDGSFSGSNVLELTFSTPIAYLSFYVIDAGSRSINYDTGSFTSGSTNSSGDSAEFRGIVFAPGEFPTTITAPFDPSGTSGWAVDNLSWGTTVVPLPAGLPFLLSGLAGLVMFRRRVGALN